jgi:hypothetical protein
MKRLVFLVAAAAAAISLSACMSTGHPGGAYAGGYVDGYYDNSYGHFYDGYWGDGDVFYYRTGPNDNFRRDDARHFRHDNGGQGYHTFHARAGHAQENHASR